MAGDVSSLDRVAVVVATNRRSPFLDEALTSVERQTFTNWEGIVVDDGSEDEEALREIVSRHASFRLIRVKHGGVAMARNIGVAATEGKLVAFLDDDDVWPPEWLEHHMRAHILNPQAAATYSGTRSIDDQGRTLFVDQSKQVDRDGIARREVSLFTGTLVIKRGHFEGVGGFNPLFRRAQDLDLVLRLSASVELIHVGTVLLGYRTHAGNSTRNRFEVGLTIDRILRLHESTARQYGDVSLAKALRKSRWDNDRFRLWAATRGRAGAAGGNPRTRALELLRSIPAVPRGIASVVLRRWEGRS